MSVDDPDQAMSRPAADNAPFSALAFKIATDPFVGSLTFCRIYSGKMEAGTFVLNANKVRRGGEGFRQCWRVTEASPPPRDLWGQ